MTGEKDAPAEMPGGRSIWEVANQLGGYIGPNTPDDLVAFLSRESDAAAALAERIVSLEARALAAEAAACAVLMHRVGELPTAGYLRDNNASRKALAALAQIAAPGAAMEAP